MKKIVALALTLIMVFALAAVGPVSFADEQTVKVGFIFLHDEQSTYDLNFMTAAQQACEKLGIEYVNKVGIPEGQECYEAAMDLVDIPEDASMAFHNARNDAWYTALVFKTLENPDKVLEYPLKPRNLLHTPRAARKEAGGEAFDSIQAALSSESALHPACPRCGSTKLSATL